MSSASSRPCSTCWRARLTGHRVAGAPGIYVRLDDPSGHAALRCRDAVRSVRAGLARSRRSASRCRHRTYHGVALNVAMDLEPFARINPCGYAGLKTVDLATLGVDATVGRSCRVARCTRCRHCCLPEPRMTIAQRHPERLRRLRPTAKQKAQAKTARIPIKVVPRRALKKPDWIRVKAGSPTTRFYEIKQILREHRCTRCARRPRARTSASASAMARRPS